MATPQVLGPHAPIRPKEHEEAAIRTLTEVDRMIHLTGTHHTYRSAHAAARAWLRAARDRADDLQRLMALALLARVTARAAFNSNLTEQAVDAEFVRR